MSCKVDVETLDYVYSLLEMNYRSCDAASLDKKSLSFIHKITSVGLNGYLHVVITRISLEPDDCILYGNVRCRSHFDVRIWTLLRNFLELDVLSKVDIEWTCDIFLITYCLYDYGVYLITCILFRNISKGDLSETEHVSQIDWHAARYVILVILSLVALRSV